MGTTYSVKIVKDRLETPSNLKAEIDSILLEVNRQMSTYIPESEISRFNSSEATEWFPVSIDFAKVVDKTKQIGMETEGALDLTIGPLVNLWGFGPDQKPVSIPSEQDIADAKQKVGLNKIEVRTNPPALKKSIPELYCDLSASAKGFGVDKLSEFISNLNFENFLIEIGGEIRVSGKNQLNNAWKIGIADPDLPGEINEVVSLKDMAMATSGDYWNYFEEDGIRYSHTIDSRTGKPITHKLASVTVLNESCMIADAYATAINVMGPEKGFEFAEKMKLPAYFIVRDNKGFIKRSTKLFDLHIKKI